MKSKFFEDSTCMIQPRPKKPHKLIKKHASMLIQYYNMWKAPKIKKAFLTAMKMFIFDHIQLRNKKTLQEKNIFCLFYGLVYNNRLATNSIL